MDGGCTVANGCAPFATQTYGRLATGQYDYPVSLLPLDNFADYLAEHRTARKRAARARRLGYRAGLIDRADHLEDIHQVNLSAPERQGRPMTQAYVDPPAHTRLPEYTCPRHRIDQWGVFWGETLVGYLVMYVVGGMALVSQILGHAGHQANDIMYLLATSALAVLPLPIIVFYNRWDSGTDGLRYFKSRLGFRPKRAEWVLK